MPGGGQGTGALGGVPKPNQFGWYKRRLPVVTPLPMPPNAGVVPFLPPPVLVVQQPRRQKTNPGAFFKPALLRSGPVNVAGGVIRPFVVRKDYERGGKVYYAIPFLKTPPAPVAGGAPPPWVRRWDFERAGLFYRERNFFVVPLIVPPPPPTLVDGAIWYALGRDNEWDSDKRFITWSADVATFLTKRSGETRLYAMDFSALPELQNANLAGVTSVTATPLTVGAGNVTLTNPALGSNGKTAVVWIAGGVSGASYKITFTVTVAGGTTLEDFGYLLVEDS